MVSTAFRPWWTTFLAVTFLVWSGHGGQIVWLLTGGIESAAPVFGFACETVRTLSHSPQSRRVLKFGVARGRTE